jgi:alpha-D-ribose 1-methylphosphonate 5-triphosphate synthase subunit PhnI
VAKKMTQMKQRQSANSTNFLVSVHYQDNHSWQGVIQWLDTGKKVHFRSELELLNLMKEATMTTIETEQLRTWHDDDLQGIL